MSTRARPEGGLLVRAAAAADAAAIGAVHAEAWRVAYADVFSPAALATAVSQRRSTGVSLVAKLVCDFEPQLRDGSYLLVAAAGNRVVGFAHFATGRTAGSDPEIFACYVHPDSWGTGAAQALWSRVQSALTAGARPGTVGRGVLWTLAGAVRARSFYERQGWVATGRTRTHDFGVGEAVAVVEYRRA